MPYANTSNVSARNSFTFYFKTALKAERLLSAALSAPLQSTHLRLNSTICYWVKIGFVICLPTVWYMKIFFVHMLEFFKIERFTQTNQTTHKSIPQEIKTPKQQLPTVFPTYRWYSKYSLYVVPGNYCGKKVNPPLSIFLYSKEPHNSLVLQWLLVRTPPLLQNKQTISSGKLNNCHLTVGDTPNILWHICKCLALAYFGSPLLRRAV